MAREHLLNGLFCATSSQAYLISLFDGPVQWERVRLMEAERSGG